VEYDFWIPTGLGFRVNLDFSPNEHKPVAGYKHGRVLCLGFTVYEGYGVFNVAAYAKLIRPERLCGVYGYLQQYFDRQYKSQMELSQPTRPAFLSPYGSFFRHRTRRRRW